MNTQIFFGLLICGAVPLSTAYPAVESVPNPAVRLAGDPQKTSVEEVLQPAESHQRHGWGGGYGDWGHGGYGPGGYGHGSYGHSGYGHTGYGHSGYGHGGHGYGGYGPGLGYSSGGGYGGLGYGLGYGGVYVDRGFGFGGIWGR